MLPALAAQLPESPERLEEAAKQLMEEDPTFVGPVDRKRKGDDSSGGTPGKRVFTEEHREKLRAGQARRRGREASRDAADEHGSDDDVEAADKEYSGAGRRRQRRRVSGAEALGGTVPVSVEAPPPPARWRLRQKVAESLVRKLTFYHVSQTLANMPANIG